MKFPCAIDTKAQRFCERIAAEMIRRFSISKEETVARINHQWSNLKIGGPDEVAYHEDEEYWAQTIYLGKESCWWITGKSQNGWVSG